MPCGITNCPIIIFTTDVAAPVPGANTAGTAVATTYVNSIFEVESSMFTYFIV